MDNNQNPKKAMIFKANRLLQARAGVGNVDEKAIAKGQALINENPFDFAPLALENLNKIQQLITKARALSKGQEQAFAAALTDPVMQLKANAKMFGYDLVGSLSDVVMLFLESTKTVDHDILDIVEAFHKTLTLLVDGRMKGDGAAYGEELRQELTQACERYLAKKSGSFEKTLSDDDIYYVDF